MLLNTVDQTISIPEAKRSKAVQMLRKVIDSEKVTVLTLQQLTGLLKLHLKSNCARKSILQGGCKNFYFNFGLKADFK